MKITKQRMKEIIVFCYGALEDLVNEGVLECPTANIKMTDRARLMIIDMTADGREPTSEEINAAMNSLYMSGIVAFEKEQFNGRLN